MILKVCDITVKNKTFCKQLNHVGELLAKKDMVLEKRFNYTDKHRNLSNLQMSPRADKGAADIPQVWKSGKIRP